MNKKIIAAGLILALVLVLIATTMYVPKGYISMSSDGKQIYNEGTYMLSTSPFEYNKIFPLKGNSTNDAMIYGIDMNGVEMKINASWSLNDTDINAMKHLSDTNDGDGSANPIQGLIKAIYVKIDPENAQEIYGISYRREIGAHVIVDTKIEFARWATVNDMVNANNFADAEERISEYSSAMLADNGIRINSISLSTPYDEAVREKKRAEEHAEKIKDDAEKEVAIKKMEAERIIKAAELENASIILPCFDWIDVPMNESLTAKKVCGYDLEIKASRVIGNEMPLRIGLISPSFENVRLTLVRIDGSRNFEEGFTTIINKRFSLDIMEKDLIIKIQKREKDIATLQIERYGVGY